MTPRVLDPSEIDEITAFEMARLVREIPDENEQMFAIWRAPWRKESLEYYLPKGWCFGMRDSKEKLVGYFLAQPLLFFRGMTQSLWIEYFAYENREIAELLLDLAKRYSRDKHLQSLLFRKPEDFSASGAKEIDALIFEIQTTRLQD